MHDGRAADPESIAAPWTSSKKQEYIWIYQVQLFVTSNGPVT